MGHHTMSVLEVLIINASVSYMRHALEVLAPQHSVIKACYLTAIELVTLFEIFLKFPFKNFSHTRRAVLQ